MKKAIALVLAALLVLSSAACGAKQQSVEENEAVKRLMSEYELLEDLPSEYRSETAIDNGDVITIHGKDYNENKLDSFMESYAKKEPGFVRFTHYTLEGDAIIKDILYDGKSMLIKYDSTRDKFAAPENRKVIYYKATDIIVSEKDGGTQIDARLIGGETIGIKWISGK